MSREASRLNNEGMRKVGYSEVGSDSNGHRIDGLDRAEQGADDVDGGTTPFNGDFLKSIVFGGLDGLITSLAIMAGAAGGGFNWMTVLVVGISSVVANAISVGAGEYLSSKAHKEFVQAEKRRETWEFKHFKDVEVKEMVKRFVSRGMGEADAKVVVAKMAQYEGFFVNLMVTEELGLQLPEDDDASLLTDAFLMALSFAIIGCLPLLTYFLGMATALKLDDQELFVIGAVVSGLLLFTLGSMKSCFSNVLWVLSGFESLVVAAVCAAAAFAVGSGIRSIV